MGKLNLNDLDNMIKMWIDKVFNNTIEYCEFALMQKPNPKGTEIISKMILFKEKVRHGDSKVLSNRDSLHDLEQHIIALLIGWNPEITYQTERFWNVVRQILEHDANFTIEPSSHPFKNLIGGLESLKKYIIVIKLI